MLAIILLGWVSHVGVRMDISHFGVEDHATHPAVSVVIGVTIIIFAIYIIGYFLWKNFLNLALP